MQQNIIIFFKEDNYFSSKENQFTVERILSAKDKAEKILL